MTYDIEKQMIKYCVFFLTTTLPTLEKRSDELLNAKGNTSLLILWLFVVLKMGARVGVE